MTKPARQRLRVRTHALGAVALAALAVAGGGISDTNAALLSPTYTSIEFAPIAGTDDTQAGSLNRDGDMTVFSQAVGVFYGAFYDGSSYGRACQLTRAGGVNSFDLIASTIEVKQGKYVRSHAATCQGTTQVDLGTGGWENSTAGDINDMGQAVGRRFNGISGGGPGSGASRVGSAPASRRWLSSSAQDPDVALRPPRAGVLYSAATLAGLLSTRPDLS